MKRMYIWMFGILFLLLPAPAHCAVLRSEPDEVIDSVYQKTDEMPAPAGGMEALIRNIAYPEEAKKKGKEGRVFVSAIISESGKATKVTVKKGVDKLLDAAAVDAVSKTAFTPGKIAGKPVKTQIVIPIQFKLDEKTDGAKNEDQPFPVGGMEALMRNIKYPAAAKEAGTQGKVVVRATIDENGNTVETSILKSVSPECDEEAARAIRVSKFTPAKKNGKPVKAEIVIPVMFKLQ